MLIKVLPALVGCLAVACNDGVPEQEFYRCDDVSAQIEEALRRDIEAGFLPADAIACELTADSFGPGLVGETRSPCRVSPNVEEGPSAECPIGTNLGHEVLDPELRDLRLDDYIHACEIQADVCAGIPVPIPEPAEDPSGPPEPPPPALPPATAN